MMRLTVLIQKPTATMRATTTCICLGFLVVSFGLHQSGNGQEYYKSSTHQAVSASLGDMRDHQPAHTHPTMGDEYFRAHSHGNQHHHFLAHGERHSRIRLEEFNIYPTFSYLGEQVGNYTEFEFATKTDLGRWEMENRTVMNVADLPGTINLGPTNPTNSPPQLNVRGNGFGDILSGFFFSRKKHGAHSHNRSHLGLGPVITFDTASNEILGSGQMTIGPGAHFSTEIGRLTTGFFVWQSWGLTDDPNVKRVNQLFGKPFFLYELTPKWQLVYIPLGLSHSWKAPKGDDWTVPIGGGLRRLIPLHNGKKLGLQMQAFDYVARKPKDPEWELRFTIEYLFGE